MPKLSFDDTNLATCFTGAALIFGLITQFLSFRQLEFQSETLSWAILPILTSILRQFEAIDTVPSCNLSASSLWTIAVGIATFTVFHAERGTIALSPALTLCVLIIENLRESRLATSSIVDVPPWRSAGRPFWIASFISLFIIVTISSWNFEDYAISVIPVGALLASLVTLMPMTTRSNRVQRSASISEWISRLWWRTAAVLLVPSVVDVAAFGVPAVSPGRFLALTITRALMWLIMSYMAQLSSWSTVTALGTFVITASAHPFTPASDIQSLPHAIACVLALGQVVYLLPARAKSRMWLWALLLFAFLPYAVSIFATSRAQSSMVHSHEHPIESLMKHAESRHENLLQRQSQNYTAAFAEYQRRYEIDPPPGFESWVEFAIAHESPIIDEFDTLQRGISPFLGLSGKTVLDLMVKAYKLPGSDFWLCKFSGASGTTECTHSSRPVDRNTQAMFNYLLRPLAGSLPDVMFLVNHMDEPRVLVPSRSQAERDDFNHGVQPAELPQTLTWEDMTESCDWEAEEGHPESQESPPFVTDVSSATDLCRHPEYRSMHGLFQSPTSFRALRALIPILSTGSLSTMSDILYPSPAYMERDFHYEEDEDPEWHHKGDCLYWAGSTTGGFAVDNQWRHYHRQRFVDLAQNLERREHYYLREKAGVVSWVKSFFFNSRIFDVAFTRLTQCQRQACREQSKHFVFKPWAHPSRAYLSKLVFDIDGNGISGRFYKLLASRSAPLKQTALREWHDDRLMPWVHYIPISLSMEELPEMAFWLTSTPAGQQRAEQIANQGREWFSKAFRDVDRTVYLCRLLLELARLQDPQRPAA